MFTIKQQEKEIPPDDVVLYSSLAWGEGFTHLDEEYLCIKTRTGHMYCTGPESEFYNGDLGTKTKVRRVNLNYLWSRPE